MATALMLAAGAGFIAGVVFRDRTRAGARLAALIAAIAGGIGAALEYVGPWFVSMF
jgi:hypothetical protein